MGTKNKLEKTYIYKIISTIFIVLSTIIVIAAWLYTTFGYSIGLIYGLSLPTYIWMIIQNLLNPTTVHAWLFIVSIFISIYFRTKARRIKLQSLPKAKSKNKIKKMRNIYVTVSVISVILFVINIIIIAVRDIRYIGYEDSLVQWYALERLWSAIPPQLVLLIIPIIYGIEAKRLQALLPKTKSKQSQY